MDFVGLNLSNQQIAQELGLNKVLIEEEVGTNLSTTEMYDFATRMPQIGFLDLKLAVVDRKADDMAENEFGELVARNRGVNARLFRGLEDAKSWLLSE